MLSWATSGKVQVAAGWASIRVSSTSPKPVPCFHANYCLAWQAGMWRGWIFPKNTCFPKFSAKTNPVSCSQGFIYEHSHSAELLGMGGTERPVEVNTADGDSKDGIWTYHFISGPGLCWQNRELSLLLQKCQLFTGFYSENEK